jgi:hypothetical protein
MLEEGGARRMHCTQPKAACNASRGASPPLALVATVADKMVQRITLLAPLPCTVQEESSALRQIEGGTILPIPCALHNTYEFNSWNKIDRG